AGRIFALTLTDEGPNLDDQASKLWSSRATFQKYASSNPLVAHETPLRSTHSNQSDRHPSVQPRNPTRGPLDKRERNRRTSKAHETLTTIESRVHSVRVRLLSPLSRGGLQEVSTELTALRSAAENVRRRVASVESRKEALCQSLDDLLARLATKVGNLPQKHDPVQYNCDHLYDLPVDRCDQVAQVSIFLGVACSVLFGVSRHAGNLIMGLVALLLKV
ncbi:hypothetical protein BV22DRAFT_977066, partial [Leucogyrophana mollusca]